MIKAILFDFDGTLVDSTPLLRDIIKKIEQQKNIKITEQEINELTGSSVKQGKKWLEKEKHIKLTIFEEMYYFFRFVIKGTKKIIPFPETRQQLKTLQKEGFLLGIVTNAPKFYVKKILRRQALLQYFQTISTITESKVPKPNPKIVERAVEELQVKPQECILIDDHEEGIIAAQSIGMKSIRLGVRQIETQATRQATQKTLAKTIKDMITVEKNTQRTKSKNNSEKKP